VYVRRFTFLGHWFHDVGCGSGKTQKMVAAMNLGFEFASGNDFELQVLNAQFLLAMIRLEEMQETKSILGQTKIITFRANWLLCVSADGPSDLFVFGGYDLIVIWTIYLACLSKTVETVRIVLPHDSVLKQTGFVHKDDNDVNTIKVRMTNGPPYNGWVVPITPLRRERTLAIVESKTFQKAQPELVKAMKNREAFVTKAKQSKSQILNPYCPAATELACLSQWDDVKQKGTRLSPAEVNTTGMAPTKFAKSIAESFVLEYPNTYATWSSMSFKERVDAYQKITTSFDPKKLLRADDIKEITIATMNALTRQIAEGQAQNWNPASEGIYWTMQSQVDWFLSSHLGYENCQLCVYQKSLYSKSQKRPEAGQPDVLTYASDHVQLLKRTEASSAAKKTLAVASAKNKSQGNKTKKRCKSVGQSVTAKKPKCIAEVTRKSNAVVNKLAERLETVETAVEISTAETSSLPPEPAGDKKENENGISCAPQVSFGSGLNQEPGPAFPAEAAGAEELDENARAGTSSLPPEPAGDKKENENGISCAPQVSFGSGLNQEPGPAFPAEATGAEELDENARAGTLSSPTVSNRKRKASTGGANEMMAMGATLNACYTCFVAEEGANQMWRRWTGSEAQRLKSWENYQLAKSCYKDNFILCYKRRYPEVWAWVKSPIVDGRSKKGKLVKKYHPESAKIQRKKAEAVDHFENVLKRNMTRLDRHMIRHFPEDAEEWKKRRIA